MRNHGWQLPYHPLQVVAMAVFVALGFAFYVFFAPFSSVGINGNHKQQLIYHFILIAIYTPLLLSSFGLYIWCAAVDPADPGVFRSKKYTGISDKHGPMLSEEKTSSARCCYRVTAALASLPCVCLRESDSKSSDQRSDEDQLYFCSLCRVEVLKYSKHCRVCNKCVDNFDHHCRWLNNCIGKRNYRKFFALMVSGLLLLVLQWSTGILVLVLCFLDRKQFVVDISSKLGSSFTVVSFVIVVAVFTILAMIATLPLAQLFFFHILLIKKGITTYDYVIALREQERPSGREDEHSPQMSPVSSLTGISSVSSFNTFNRAAAWCTPPRLFVEDQFDAVPTDNGSITSFRKKTTTSGEQETVKKLPAPVKISPWTLARLNANDVSKAADEARKKSKILRPVPRLEPKYLNDETDGKRIRLPVESLSTLRHKTVDLPVIAASSSESSLDSPDILRSRLTSSMATATASRNDVAIPFSRSTSDGYDASGGEDSDRVPTRIVHRLSDWRSLPIVSGSRQNIGRSAPLKL
ncbi:probable protein S-acyltransferase 22 [Andrographis paniculata]|uniref:probable protein S-acyltransferase 22 n=1 Tax=Andrographis paniculata TaxID=175694 RepID=UPI0021E9039D|nr:probable protein S-acyltransferase 22 [Andrographis paniculata]